MTAAGAPPPPAHERPQATGQAQHPPGTQRPRRRRQVDWELITCGIKGHVLVGRDLELPEEDQALVVHDDGDIRWHRCLRCDTWIALPRSADEAHPRPVTRDEIELPLRGKPLHDRVILRLIAVDRVIHFIVLGLLGIGVLAFTADRAHLRGAFYRVLTALQGGVAGGPVQTTGHVGILHDFDRLFTLRTATLREAGIALLAYGALEGAEALGLWFGKRWAEYLTFISTTVLLPLEIYEIIHGATPLKVIGFLINVAVVVYLLLRKRLFGLRGGRAADEAERQRDMGWEAIERSTLATPRSGVRAAPSG
ncbi:MAG TPA: DUF2127 domain-containing protein [Solirubrobacteraceae bacterium]